jgi:hypothetical protein
MRIDKLEEEQPVLRFEVTNDLDAELRSLVGR